MLLLEKSFTQTMASFQDNTWIAGFIIKHELDWSTDQATYKQKFDKPVSSASLDAALFATTIIILGLVASNRII